MSPNNVQFDTYQKMNNLMTTLINNSGNDKLKNLGGKPRSSLKNNENNALQNLNSSALRNMLNESIITSGDATPENQRQASPLTREMAKASSGGSEEISIIDNKQVNFSIAAFTSKTPVSQL